MKVLKQKSNRHERVQGGVRAVRRMISNQAVKMSRDQVAEGPKNHVRI